MYFFSQKNDLRLLGIRDRTGHLDTHTPPRMVAIDAAVDLGAEYERLTELRAGHRALDGRSTIHGV